MSSQSQYSDPLPRPSPRLKALFPAGTALAEMRGPGNLAALAPEEAEPLKAAVPKRIGEFAAGRLCAKYALAELGVLHFPLRVAPDRQPVWPETLVGSITHTAGLCLAVVAAKTQLAAIGVDSEVVGQVSPEIWDTICGAAETDWLHSLSESERPAAVTLIFSAKEAFYKCQYPLVGEWLDFEDLRVEVLNWGGEQSDFAVMPTRPLAVARHVSWPVIGRYLFHEEYVTTAVAIEQPFDPQ